MALDMKYFEEMEAKIPKGKVRTRFAPSPTGFTPGSSPGTIRAPLSCASRTLTRLGRWRAPQR